MIDMSCLVTVGCKVTRNNIMQHRDCYLSKMRNQQKTFERPIVWQGASKGVVQYRSMYKDGRGERVVAHQTAPCHYAQVYRAEPTLSPIFPVGVQPLASRW